MVILSAVMSSVNLGMRKRICSCGFFFLFGTDSTSALPGNVRPDEGQRPLNMLFLPILLSLRGHPEVGKKEGKLPAGLFDVLTAVHSVGQGLCAVLCPQAEGSQRRERRGEQMVARLVLKLNFWVCLSVMSKSAVWFFRLCHNAVTYFKLLNGTSCFFPFL